MAQTLYSLGRISEAVITLPFDGHSLGGMGLDYSVTLPLLSALFGSIFISLVVEYLSFVVDCLCFLVGSSFSPLVAL